MLFDMLYLYNDLIFNEAFEETYLSKYSKMFELSFSNLRNDVSHVLYMKSMFSGSEGEA